MSRLLHRSAFLAAVLLTFQIGSWGLAAADRNGIAFVNGIEDLPLMDGLREAEGESMVFDTAAGRIVESYASGTVTRRQVLEFYTSTLPQLGWRQSGKSTFQREDEILKLEFSAAAKPALTVRFALSPANAAAAR
ncbi:MAG TPA: hypothetical protein QF509_07260 [Rhodospirillales bacterium]|jgi:hypothetical protein|nr:hypothetical protein [Rhodospirillales bacterium]|tara:strand:+ start:189 stop:593 length:405 start_codon:yes stop_codon:yes gene_type:complete